MSLRTSAHPLVVVMGVSGSGKSTVGQELADDQGIEYTDGDSFHSDANIARMTSGHPLTDEDRAPWLAAIGGWLAEHDATGGVVSCSALRRRYRDALRSAAPRLIFLHLDGDPAVLLQRVAERHDHFMPATLLTSQLKTLEPLETDEAGIVVDFASPAADIVSAFTATTLQTNGDPS
jgi:gluconokinase